MTRTDAATGYTILLFLALVILPARVVIWIFAVMIALDFAHTLSPIVAAWSHRRFRVVMLRDWWGYLAVPGIAVAVALAFPVREVLTVYWGWNIWHFGMQNYGMTRLTGRRQPWWLCVGVTALAMAGLPLVLHGPVLGFLMTALISVNHWLVELELTSRISGQQWLFLGGVLAAGCVAFWWTIPTPHGTVIRMIPMLIGARAGLGFVHFLYDARIYRRDSLLRAALT